MPSQVFTSEVLAKSSTAIQGLWNLSTDPESMVLSGPFVLKSYKPGERLFLTRNPYFGEWNKDAVGRPLPYLEGWEFLDVKDMNAGLASFIAGDSDVFVPLSVDALSQIQKLIGQGKLNAVLKANIGPSLDCCPPWLIFNWNRKSDPDKQRLFRSTTFRQAISHLIDQQAMVDLAYGGAATPTYSIVPSILSDWVSPKLHKYTYNPQAAQALFAKLGYSKRDSQGYLVNEKGKVLEFNLNTVDFYKAVSTLLLDSFKKAGLKVNPIVRDVNSHINLFSSAGEDRGFDALVGGGLSWYFEYPIGAPFMTCAGNGHSFNMSGKCIAPWESQVEKLFFQGLQEPDLEQRKKIVYQIQDLWSENQPIIYLPASNAHLAWSARLAGEYPAALINPYNHERTIALTWIR